MRGGLCIVSPSDAQSAVLTLDPNLTPHLKSQARSIRWLWRRCCASKALSRSRNLALPSFDWLTQVGRRAARSASARACLDDHSRAYPLSRRLMR
jgi:hypothetical protein